MDNAAAIWESVMQIMKSEFGITQTTYNAWFSDSKAVEFDGETLVVTTPTDIKKSVISRMYVLNIEDALMMLFSKTKMEFCIYTEEEWNNIDKNHTEDFFSYDNYTFENFVVGNSNKFAYSAAVAVANSSEAKYNPLFIYGGSGLGKTHLLYAIVSAAQKKARESGKDSKITYITGEDFTNELIDAIEKRTLPEFRDKYRKSDILLVDDIQFIAGKKSTQEEFFHTFNALFKDHKQIVLTSDRPPKEMATLEERLQTRFEWGLPADIQPPDFETRMAIINMKAKKMGLEVTPKQAEMIATNVTANIRQLEGAVNKLLAYQELFEEEYDTEEKMEYIMRDIFAENPWINPTPEFIIKAVAKYYEIPIEDLTGKSKEASIVAARQIAMYMVRTMTDASLPQIGKSFNRDHSTVLHAINKIKESMQENDYIKNRIQEVQNSILDP